ncbi:sulfurtransferase complex subunit TusD [Alginatibacterium sediminis]|uniref:Sulfurtransferase complex subunit TusD n=1 Tax=Alginatibacterium sediminis TaxID=2164068 RepID=A0A420EJG1_9ALTE|nr:sulfurtransferase complex subunit TusD [Alginatibacterium sediminis]RKF20852.1 sulfurtransferase complex subunit TusD [Alginatibacterium sediminis]
MSNLTYLLVVNSAVYGQQSAAHALKFAQAITESEHTLSAVFFYQDGVSNALSTLLPASDEVNLVHRWKDLGRQHGVDLLVCSAAAARRGLIDETEATSADLVCTQDDAFISAGLAELAMLSLKADRVIQL